MEPAQVPQFIDIEDKVIGPLTLKQFGYLAGAGAICFIFFYLFNFFFFLIFAVPVAALGFALAFVKPNNRPFIYYLKNVIYYAVRPRLFIWKKEEKKIKEEIILPSARTKPKEEIIPEAPKMTPSKIQELAKKVDIGNF